MADVTLSEFEKVADSDELRAFARSARSLQGVRRTSVVTVSGERVVFSVEAQPGCGPQVLAAVVDAGLGFVEGDRFHCVAGTAATPGLVTDRAGVAWAKPFGLGSGPQVTISARLWSPRQAFLGVAQAMLTWDALLGGPRPHRADLRTPHGSIDGLGLGRSLEDGVGRALAGGLRTVRLVAQQAVDDMFSQLQPAPFGAPVAADRVTETLATLLEDMPNVAWCLSDDVVRMQTYDSQLCALMRETLTRGAGLVRVAQAIEREKPRSLALPPVRPVDEFGRVL